VSSLYSLAFDTLADNSGWLFLLCFPLPSLHIPAYCGVTTALYCLPFMTSMSQMQAEAR